jgi:hypothetical protein
MEQRGNSQIDFANWKIPSADVATSVIPHVNLSTVPSRFSPISDASTSVVGVKKESIPSHFIPFRSSEISTALTRARDIYVAKEKQKDKTVVAYELDQDRVVYAELAKHKGEKEYEHARNSLNDYTRMQIETHIGERLHVGISKFNFRVKDNELMAENAEESMLSMMKRGRDYRRDHGRQVDWAREDAEVYGFEETQSVLSGPETPVGTMMLSISPRGDVEKGSIYKQNFYDVYQKTEDGEVVAYRFTSGLTRAESQEKVRKFDLRYAHDEVPTDTQFLARPIRFDPTTSQFKTPHELHQYLHKEHEFMSQEEFKRTIEICTPMITSLINSLCDNPSAFLQHERNEKILLNAVDEIVQKNRRGEISVFTTKGDEKNLYVRPWIPTNADISRLLEQSVRQVDTGCGSSGGESAYSVAEAGGNTTYIGENAKNDPNLCHCSSGDGPHFHCPGKGGGCGHAIVVGKGTSSCPECGEGKVC